MFVVDQETMRVAWSPQSSTQIQFNSTDPTQWSADASNQLRFRSALMQAKAGFPIRDHEWLVDYGKRRQHYTVSIDRVNPYLIVRLYPMGKDLGITRSQMKALRFMVEGKTDQEIAEKMECSAATVRKHLEALRKKFKVKTRVALAIEAYRSNYVTPRRRKHHVR